MRPAFSVVFLTTLIGAGQGLFLALYAADLAAPLPAGFAVVGGAAAVVLAGLGLFASFFHLGRPERAWRSAAKWRTSWLSREVIALPTFIATVVAYAWCELRAPQYAHAIGAVALLACLALFVCTAMIYACIRFLQEWASPLTIANFILIGCASGCSIAAALAALRAPERATGFALAALVLTLAALASRSASLARIEQKSQGFMGGSFNTREFFHGVSREKLAAIKWGFLALGFAAPVVLLAAGIALAAPALFIAAALVQYTGLIAERWFFLAQANHPQNLYYQAMA